MDKLDFKFQNFAAKYTIKRIKKNNNGLSQFGLVARAFVGLEI